MLAPAATCIAQDMGILPTTLQKHGNVTTVMDPILSAQWASQLQQSMVPAETSRSKEDMRPMAYRLVPEVWKRLCPDSLWEKASKEEGEQNGERKKKVAASEEEVFIPVKTQIDESHAAVPTTPTTSPNHSLTLIRNPSPSYDGDAYAIFRHLHQYSNLHISCGALFGCDFLLYDGRREDRHSFAGLRVYSSVSNSSKSYSGRQNNSVNYGEEKDDTKFPIPSTYDMAGFVRTMNTARKIALVATVVRGRDDDTTGKNSGVARVVMVDLALEKVLSAPTHIRKGNTIKRRSEEEAASGLARTK
mmetsp:Transcript_21248/g.46114  ORF Transcript_21248/g.46114 Transcript_21248/m.46114 type:complete len:303 (+) Transcript_21248:933-1841(+)